MTDCVGHRHILGSAAIWLVSCLMVSPATHPATAIFALMLWTAVCPLRCQEFHGTAAMVFWTPERAILAADSKVIHTGGEPASVECKIRTAGRFSFVVSGFYGKPRSDFDAWAL